jgi:FkbM family methyltransferase
MQSGREVRARARFLQRRVRRAWRTLWANAQDGWAVDRYGPFLVAFRPETTDEVVLEKSFRRDIFFASVPEYRPQPGHTILDVGAHIGTFTLQAAQLVRPGKVYAVEASRATYDVLAANIALNRLQNVEASHLALSSHAGIVTLHHDRAGNWGHSIMAALSDSTEEVPSETLAGYFARHGIERVDFAKFNCEGAEFPILIGAPPDVLRRIRNAVVLYHCDLAQGHDRQALVDAFEHAGFTVEVRAKRPLRGSLIARLPE